MSNYHLANTTAQWFQDNYPGAAMRPNVVVLHTTEGSSWPGYGGGSMAPNYTAMPDYRRKRLVWRAHFPDERSARALVNKAGGVETNTLNAVQVELVGTCVKGGPGMYWPDAPEWALQDLADFLVDQHKRHGLRLQGPKVWLAYGKDDRRPGVWPASYGNSPARMTANQWRSFYGICGHQHVPENVHGDPGAFPFERLLELAHAKASGSPAPATETNNPVEDDMPAYSDWSAKDKRALADDLVDALLHADRVPVPDNEGDGYLRGAGKGPRVQVLSAVTRLWRRTVNVETKLDALTKALPATVAKAVQDTLRESTVQVDVTPTDNTGK